MGAECPLGSTGRPRGVEDGGVVIGVHLHGGQIHLIGDIAHHLPEAGVSRRRRMGGDGPSHHDRLQGRHPVDHVAQPFEPLTVTEQHLGPRVTQAVVQLLGAPPRVQGHDDRSRRRCRPERQRPLGHVAHGHRHPVAFPDPVAIPEDAGQVRGDAEVLLEAVALVLVDQEGGVAVAPTRAQDVRQGRRRPLPHPRLDPPHQGLVHLEHLAGSGQRCVRLGKGQGHQTTKRLSHPPRTRSATDAGVSSRASGATASTIARWSA